MKASKVKSQVEQKIVKIFDLALIQQLSRQKMMLMVFIYLIVMTV